jgi:hypothetical protein
MKAQERILEPACSVFEEDLVLYYYGDGSAEDRCRVETHIGGCARCQRFLQDLKVLLPQIAKPTELPPTFWDNYYREMTEKLSVERERKAWWRSWFAPMNIWLVPAFGTVAMAVLAFALVIGKGHWQGETKNIDEAIPQEVIADGKQLEFFDSLDMLEALRAQEQNQGTSNQATAS